MQKRYRTILPSSSRPVAIDESTDQEQPKRRRTAGRVACEKCRTTKTACDGKHPACARCIRLEVACQYRSTGTEKTADIALTQQIDQLQRELSEHAGILEHLRSVTDADALAVIRRLRSTPNAAMALSSICGSAHTATRLSELKALRGTIPPTNFEIEAELSVLHQSVYPALTPLDLDTIDIDSLLQPSSTRLSAVMPMGATEQTERVSPSIPSIAMLPPSPLRGTRLPQTSPIAGPAPGRQYCDYRLAQLKIDYWTCIPIGNEFAACVLSHYLETDHPIFACVDAALFLSSLVDRSLEHCSPFLVSALLAFACQSYAQFDKRSLAFSIAFMDEAEKLWRAEQHSRITNNLAALSYLAIATGISGKDELGHLFAVEVRNLAQNMGVFGICPTDELVLKYHGLSPDKIKSLASASWGAYTWLTLGRSTVTWGLWLIITTLSKLWVMIQQTNTLYILTGNTPLEKQVPLSFAESMYQRLLNWSDTLLPDMLHGKHSPAHVLFFHALYHSTVLFLFQPFQKSAKDFRLRSFSSVDATPSAVYAASIKQLKNLVYVHRARTPRLPTDCWFNTAVLRVSVEVVKSAAYEPDWYFYFRLCVAFWKDAYRCYCTFRLIAQGNLAAALHSGALRSDDASAMMKELSAAGKHHVAPDKAFIRGLLDFDLATRSVHDAQISTLARQFDDLILFDELTTGDFNYTAEHST
ncbi:hypothetical protein OPT61_g7694 [Boeremia exigua]|uniref:Uncharacterized protein n=1 Tax=Boeremia exigua TaxID=749465 RepID=A0ACC2I2H3_9PLEO|nr:hypothetical protein OPT61_g7694 [Boeremia exigua]